MGWFSKKDTDSAINKPQDMSPLEAVTHLCASIQLADGHADHEEREVWLEAIEKLFPEFSEERADKFLMEAQTILNKKTGTERIGHIKDILKRIQALLSSDQIKKLSTNYGTVSAQARLHRLPDLMCNNQLSMSPLGRSLIAVATPPQP